MRCPPSRQQVLKVFGDLGVAKARQAPVDPAHIDRWRGPIALDAHQRQAEAMGGVAPGVHLVDRERDGIGSIRPALHLASIAYI